MHADVINPFINATVSVFSRMLGFDVTREKPFVSTDLATQHEVTGIISLAGRATGMVAVSFSSDAALAITEKLLGERPNDINPMVIDAVGEMANMIAGAAKAQLEALELTIGLPIVLVGKSSRLGFPSRATPISIPFQTPLGPLVVEVGIVPVEA